MNQTAYGNRAPAHWAEGCVAHVATDQARCGLCGGNAGKLVAGRAHVLCSALAMRGMPTPSLGDACSCCNGTGGHPRSAVGPVDPNQDQVERWCPGCTTCGATGAVRVGPKADPLFSLAAAARAEMARIRDELGDLADHAPKPDPPYVIRSVLALVQTLDVRLSLLEQGLEMWKSAVEKLNEQVKRSLDQTERALSQTERLLAPTMTLHPSAGAAPVPRRRPVKLEPPLGQGAKVRYAAFGQVLDAQVIEPSTSSRVRSEFVHPRTGETVQRNVHRYKLRSPTP
ncbi:MAG TPA: hypothetical protein VGP64_18030 [Polyangia bacterium]